MTRITVRSAISEAVEEDSSKLTSQILYKYRRHTAREAVEEDSSKLTSAECAHNTRIFRFGMISKPVKPLPGRKNA